jgi:hypothetical protein
MSYSINLRVVRNQICSYMMQQIFKQDFIDAVERNYLLNEKYFSYQNKVFYGFETRIREIGKCLILNLNYATITLTNHLLERLLKLALIEKAIGLQLKPIHKLTEIYSGPSKKYGSLTMGSSIDQCKKECLINAEDREFLFVFVRETLRNGFSHADAQKVLSKMKDETQYYIANEKDKK